MWVLMSRTPQGQLERPLDEGLRVGEDRPRVVGEGLAEAVVAHHLQAQGGGPVFVGRSGVLGEILEDRLVLVRFRKAPQEHLEALVKGSAEDQGSVAGVSFAAVYEAVAARRGASGKHFHRAVVEHEEVVPVLRQGG